MYRIIFGICLALLGGQSWAQCCSGGVPIAGNLSLPAGAGKEGQIQLTYDYNRLRALFNESQNLQDRTRQRSTHSVLLEASYGFHPRWSVATLFSYVVQERIIETIPGRRQFDQTSGIGDVVFLLRHTLVNNQYWGWSLGAGPKLPVGRHNIRDEDGFWLSADLQPGSGAWDAIFWTSLSRFHLLKENLAFNLTGTVRLTGRTERLEGTQLYEFGNEYQAYLGFSDRFVIGKWLIDPLYMFRFRHVSVDVVNRLPLPNTGGTFFHAVPGIVLTPRKNFSFRISGEIPLYRFVEGTQLATSQKVTLGLFFRLAPQKINIPEFDIE